MSSSKSTDVGWETVSSRWLRIYNICNVIYRVSWGPRCEEKCSTPLTLCPRMSAVAYSVHLRANHSQKLRHASLKNMLNRRSSKRRELKERYLFLSLYFYFFLMMEIQMELHMRHHCSNLFCVHTYLHHYYISFSFTYIGMYVNIVLVICMILDHLRSERY